MINNRKEESNSTVISGRVLEELKFSHSTFGENFYSTKLAVKRSSGIFDTIPVIISERVTNINFVKMDSFVQITGEFRSHNTQEHRLDLFVFAKKIKLLDTETYENQIVLLGYFCRQPEYRKTPLGREIADVILAVNRSNYNKSDYIPLIFWGRTAEYVSNFNVGEKIKIHGRIQSRDYSKNKEDGSVEERVAYEVSSSIFNECVE